MMQRFLHEWLCYERSCICCLRLRAQNDEVPNEPGRPPAIGCNGLS